MRLIVDFEQDTTAKVYEVEILFSQDGIIIEKELTFNEQYDFVGALIDIDDALLVKFVQRIPHCRTVSRTNQTNRRK